MRVKVISITALLILCLSSAGIFAEEGMIETLKFQDADIRLVLQAIAQKATRSGKKINIIMTPEVQGLVTVDLEDIDWETALKVVLKTYGYGYSVFGDVITIAPLDKIKEGEAKEKERQSTEAPQLRVFKLKYIDANDAKKAIEPLLSAVGKASVLELSGQTGWEFGTDLSKRAKAQGKISRTKVLFVSDLTRKMDEVANLIRDIDVMPKQVLIRAKIMEVDRNLLRDIGFEWGTGSSGAESSTMYPTPTSKSSKGVDITEVAGHVLSPQPSIFSPQTTGLTTDNAGLKVLFKKLTGAQFEMIAHALEEDTRTNTLSSPVILTLSNQEASILVGLKFPIIKTDVSTENSNVIGGSLQEYKDIGIQLNVVPQVWGPKDEYINMIVHPSVTSYTQTVKVKSQSGDTLVEYPIITSREAETQLVLKDGETIVMGGLLKDVKSHQDIGIPFLSKIPILGFLFKRDASDIEKMDLLIFITAKIVKPGEIVSKELIDTTVVGPSPERK
ncbi:MAG: secretin N-terminal domain-containing protein [Candidatus Omnitrophota bacterium]